MIRSRLSRSLVACAALIAACARCRLAVAELHVVRTQFSFPVEDHRLIETLQTRGLRQGLRLTKNQIVRAGLRVLDAMTPGAFG